MVTELEAKICSDCKILKFEDEFYTNNKKIQAYCKFCSIIRVTKWNKDNKERVKIRSKKFRDSHPNNHRKYLVKGYGLSLEDYNDLLIKQNNKCAICSKESIKEFLNIDHCHKSNKIRGLLCRTCNRILGLFKDDIGLLLKAADYLFREGSINNE